MHSTKALYNHLRYLAREDSTLKVDSWAVEDLRILPMEKLWEKLHQLGVHIDQASFIHFSHDCDTPEELTDLLVNENLTNQNQDRIYLILFEIWRRILPEKVSISIFCDEMDHLIDQYDQDMLETDEKIQDALAVLAEILAEHVDAKVKPKIAFEKLAEHCANDLEIFIYDYISDLLDQNNLSYATELFELFSIYFFHLADWQFLQARILSFSDITEANRRLEELLSKEIELDLLFEILEMLVSVGEKELFPLVLKKMIPLLSSDDFEDVCALSAEYFRRLDLEKAEVKVLELKKSKKSFPEILKEFQKIVGNTISEK